MAFDKASAIRVCQPRPVAFQRASVSGGRRNDIDVRAMPDFGRPRGFIILDAAAALKISGKTSRALRARAKVSFVHAGLSRLVLSGLRLRFIMFHFAFVCLAQTDHVSLISAGSKYHHMESLANQAQHLKSALTILSAQILSDQVHFPRQIPLPPRRRSRAWRCFAHFWRNQN
jgi:hypothetical protein